MAVVPGLCVIANEGGGRWVGHTQPGANRAEVAALKQVVSRVAAEFDAGVQYKKAKFDVTRRPEPSAMEQHTNRMEGLS